MTQEEKSLLLQDLCARLPYGVKVQVYYEDMSGSGYFNETVWIVDNDEPFHVNDRWIENVKPYLRPMSSMTEEEKKEYEKVCELDTEILTKHPMNGEPFPALYNSQNWLNKHHFDYRGLIPMGLALEAPKDMYCTSQKWTPLRSGLKENEYGQIVGGLKL